MPIEVKVRAGKDQFVDDLSAVAGSRVQIVTSVRNLGSATSNDTVIKLVLSPSLTLVKGSCQTRTSRNNKLVHCDDNFTSGGILYRQFGGNGWVQFYVNAVIAKDVASDQPVIARAWVNSNETPEEHDDARIQVGASDGRFYPSRPLLDLKSRKGRAQTSHGPIMNSAKGPFGDERSFLDAFRASETHAGSHADLIYYPTGSGGVVALRLYVRNDADPATNASGQGVARGTRVRVALPSGSGTALRARGYISIDNAAPGWPQTVENTVDFADAFPFRLRYIPGSARIFNDGPLDGSSLPDSIVTSGTLIGYEALDGRMPGGLKFDAVIEVKARATRQPTS